jgi:hypothetical protein
LIVEVQARRKKGNAENRVAFGGEALAIHYRWAHAVAAVFT